MNSINKNRLVSIDILRALTMTLMIFVNDLWSLSGILPCAAPVCGNAAAMILAIGGHGYYALTPGYKA